MTLGELRTLIRLTLADATAWPDATLDRWIQAAIRLYGAHFPRRCRVTLTLAAGQPSYAAPGGVSAAGVISVEYPAGQAPPRFLRCVAESAPVFGAGGQVYALRGVAADDPTAAAALVFAEPVGDGETAVVEYWGPHLLPQVGVNSALITVPAQHLEALAAYVEFAALHEQETGEALTTDGSTILLAQLGENARRAWNRVKEVYDRLTYLGALETGGVQPGWGDYGL